VRWSLPILALLLVACGAPPAPPAEPLEVPPFAEAPTPPPGPTGDDIGSLLPVEPPLPPGARPPEPTPEPPPKSEPTQVPAGAKRITFDKVVTAGSVVDRKPKGEATRFKDGSEVSCWMAVTNPGPVRRLRHQWSHNGARKSSIPVTVKGPTWRTWTSRPVYGVGKWTVDIVDEEGGVLHSVAFEVQ